MQESKVKIEPIIFILFFEIWVMSSPIIFCISKFSRITKNRVEDAVTINVKKSRHLLNFKDMKNPLCTNYSFINSLQNVQSNMQFLIQLKFKLFVFFSHHFYLRFVLKTCVGP